jgi:hypothetical protein
MDIGGFTDKIKKFISIDDVTAVLEKIPYDDPTLKEISKDASFVGGSIKIALHILETVYNASNTASEASLSYSHENNARICERFYTILCF